MSPAQRREARGRRGTRRVSGWVVVCHHVGERRVEVEPDLGVTPAEGSPAGRSAAGHLAEVGGVARVDGIAGGIGGQQAGEVEPRLGVSDHAERLGLSHGRLDPLPACDGATLTELDGSVAPVVWRPFDDTEELLPLFPLAAADRISEMSTSA